MRTLIVFLLFSIPLYANPSKPKAIVKIISETDMREPLKLTSHFKPASGFELRLNGKKVYEYGDATGGGPEFIFQGHLGSKSRFLGVLDVYQGDGCPEMNVVVAVYSSKDVKVTEPFGNCEGPKKISVTDGKLELEFGPRKSVSGDMPAATWTFEDHQLKKL